MLPKTAPAGQHAVHEKHLFVGEIPACGQSMGMVPAAAVGKQPGAGKLEMAVTMRTDNFKTPVIRVVADQLVKPGPGFDPLPVDVPVQPGAAGPALTAVTRNDHILFQDGQAYFSDQSSQGE